jgi:hypothetical protein
MGRKKPIQDSNGIYAYAAPYIGEPFIPGPVEDTPIISLYAVINPSEPFIPWLPPPQVPITPDQEMENIRKEIRELKEGIRKNIDTERAMRKAAEQALARLKKKKKKKG